MTAHPDIGAVSSKIRRTDSHAEAKLAAGAIGETAYRPSSFPIRSTFVQLVSDDSREAAPLSRIVSRKGGGEVPLKLFLALVWMSSAEPFSTRVPARRWAEALGLIDPAKQGARRIVSALELLEELNLVTVARSRGDASEVTIRDESGTTLKGGGPKPYVLPYDAYRQAKARRNPRGSKPDHSNRYFKFPTELWTHKADIQRMSPAALAMLLAYLNEARIESDEVWWSTGAFPERYGISPAMRTRGTKELIEKWKLLRVKKRSVGRPGAPRSFTPERVRNVYSPTIRLDKYMSAAAKVR